MTHARRLERREDQRERREGEHAGPGFGLGEVTDSNDRHQRRDRQHLDHVPARHRVHRAHREREVRRAAPARNRPQHEQPQRDQHGRRDDRGGDGQHRNKMLALLPGDRRSAGERGVGMLAAQPDRDDRAQVRDQEHDQRGDAEREQ